MWATKKVCVVNTSNEPYKSCVYCEWSRRTIRCKLYNIYYELLVKIRTHIWTMSPLISLIGYLKWLTNYPNNRKTPLTLFKLRYCSLNSICGASDIQFSSVQDILKNSLDSRGMWHYEVSLLTREITSVSVLLSQYSLKWNNFSPTGNWWFNPITGWYPYSFDHSVDLRGDNGPETMFVERSLVRKSI